MVREREKEREIDRQIDNIDRYRYMKKRLCGKERSQTALGSHENSHDLSQEPAMT